MKHTVFVGLSGGVDSAVSAALLQEQGYDVVGAFIKIWQPEFTECTWREDRLDAIRVCAALDIPFREIDLSDAYKKDVVEEMLAAYTKGITPNPDVLCNRAIKFGAFLAWARGEGARSIATGHYARIKRDLTRFELLRASDASKDQSYFLYRLLQSDLHQTLFPIGGMTKAKVRAEAKRRALPVADKPDSQGLCFVGEISMRDFLARFIPLERGAIVDEAGTVVGEHEGAALYTLGQRHGLSTHGVPDPYYVIGVDVPNNIVRVSHRRDAAACAAAVLESDTWVYRAPRSGTNVLAQARYHEPPVPARITKQEDRWVVSFERPRIASPGQSLVLYLPAEASARATDGEVCIGGGMIAATHNACLA